MQLPKGPASQNPKWKPQFSDVPCTFDKCKFVPSLGIPAGSAAASIPTGGWKASCPILRSCWCSTSPNMFQLCCTLGWPGTLRLKIWDVPLWVTMVRHSEGSLSQLIRVEPSPKLPNKLDSETVFSCFLSSNLLTSMTTNTTSTTSSNTKWPRGNARPTLEEVWRSPLCTSPALRT